jgi:aminoglycoside phosphotransferase (APT) family kinase protein
MREFDPYDTNTVRARLAEYLAARTGDEVDVGELKRYTVGFSWVTYGFHAAWSEAGRRRERELILRVGPPNGVFSPYKASPEFLTLSSLAGSGVPVPRVYWHSDAPDTFGAPFFICDLVEGEAPIPWTHDGGPAFDEERRVVIGGQFVEALAALHNFQWQDTPVAGIDGCRDPARTAYRQIEHWEGLLAQWSAHRVPMLELAAIWLRDNAPAAPRIAIVHGDFRIGNFLEKDDRITAILDWELVRLGDPIEDLGWVCLQAWRGRSPHMCHLFSREELRDRYAGLTGIDVDLADIRYWEVFGTYKLAIMHYGATHCYEKRGFNDLRMAGMGAQIPRLLLQVEGAMERAA